MSECLVFYKTVNSKSVFTIPAEVRKVLGIRRGDIIEFRVRVLMRGNHSPKTPGRNKTYVDVRRPRI